MLKLDGAASRRARRPAEVALRQGRTLPLGQHTLIQGVVNVTPDSFFPGSRTPRHEEAIERALRMAAEGADIIDIGGESTRPGAQGVPEGEEIERVIPVIEGLRKASPVAISIDTRKAVVAEAALAAGADIVNDTSALLADPAMSALVARSGAVVILMHMRGTPATMQDEARYHDVVLEVKSELGLRLAAALHAGIGEDRIWLDPGLGFAKTAAHSLELLHRLEEFLVFDRPLVIGASRKSFLGRVLGESDPALRLEGTLAASAIAVLKGAQVLRVHDVGAARRTARVVEAILDPSRVE